MGWETAWEPTLDTATESGGVRNFRSILDADTSSYDGTKIRITLKAHTTNDCVVDGVSIGVMTANDDFEYDPDTWTPDQGVRFTFDTGNPGCTIPQSGTKRSDEMTLNFDKTKRYGIHTYQASKDASKYSALNGHGAYYKSSAPDDTVVQIVSYSFLANYVWLIDKIEVYEDEAEDININVIEVE